MHKSHVWKHFTREGDKARCKVARCNAVLASKATTSLSYHLEKVHKISKDSGLNVATTSQAQPQVQQAEAGAEPEVQVVQVQEAEGTPPQSQRDEPNKRQKTIHECFSFRSLEETVARMAAEDGLTIRQITQSNFIRQSLVKEFPKRTIPKCETGMIGLIETFYEKAKDEVKLLLSNLKSKGIRFSATLDEWTSLKNIRFINVNLHYAVSYNEAKYVNLGMIKIDGTCPTEDMIKLVSILLSVMRTAGDN